MSWQKGKKKKDKREFNIVIVRAVSYACDVFLVTVFLVTHHDQVYDDDGDDNDKASLTPADDCYPSDPTSHLFSFDQIIVFSNISCAIDFI